MRFREADYERRVFSFGESESYEPLWRGRFGNNNSKG